MIAALTSSWRDWGFIALGFSAGVLLDLMLALVLGRQLPATALARGGWGIAVGPLVVWSLLLRRTVPHRIVLALGAIALVMYLVGTPR